VGWLERTSGGYRVGLTLLDVGGIGLQRNGLRERAFRHLYLLAVKTGLAVQLGILDHGEVVYLDRIVLSGFDLPTRIGGRQPAYCTALGKAMLAFEDERNQDSAMATMTARTKFTIVDPRALRAEFESVVRTGVAYDREEAFYGVQCVASPIRSGGRAIGAISVTGPIERVRALSVTQDVRNAASAVWSGQAVGMSA